MAACREPGYPSEAWLNEGDIRPRPALIPGPSPVEAGIREG
jgi:hypothetical protein